MKDLTPSELKTIQEVCNALSKERCFQFAFYEQEDIEQEAFMIAWEAMDTYDGRIPLKNFLYIHLKNRLKNFKRDNYIRYRECKKCKNQDPNCLSCIEWKKKIKAKYSLMQTADVDESSFVSEALNDDEIIDLINKHLPIEHRKNFRKLLNGSYIPKNIKIKLIQCILDIISNVIDE